MRAIYIVSLFSLITFLVVGCKSNFPSDLDAFSLDMNYATPTAGFQPLVGRNTEFVDVFNADKSTLPLTFRISAVRAFDGSPAPELSKLFPTPIWKERYTGLETSLEEIRAKRDTLMLPLWEVNEHNGNFVMHSSSSSNILKVYPDSGYMFDVEVSNSGGRRYFTDIKLRPLAAEPYEVFPSTLINIYGDSTLTLIQPSTLSVWFNKKGEGSSLTFKFLDRELNAIPLSKFKDTNWENLLHGFNPKFTADSSEVRYDVEYPIPLVPTISTKWNSGANATSVFAYSRRAFGGVVQNSSIKLNYSIFERGDWEIIFYFSDESPLFTND